MPDFTENLPTLQFLCTYYWHIGNLPGYLYHVTTVSTKIGATLCFWMCCQGGQGNRRVSSFCLRKNQGPVCGSQASCGWRLTAHSALGIRKCIWNCILDTMMKIHYFTLWEDLGNTVFLILSHYSTLCSYSTVQFSEWFHLTFILHMTFNVLSIKWEQWFLHARIVRIRQHLPLQVDSKIFLFLLFQN